jgi:hypothetical protein
MGHYSAAYDFEVDRQREERAADATLFVTDVQRLRLLAEGPVGLPQRFRDALEDMQNWVTVSVPKA